MLTVRAAAATNKGHVRASNEDTAFVGTRFYVVADGMGGHAAGGVASALAVARLSSLDDEPELNAERLRAYVSLVNTDILDAARADPQIKGMGTTVAGLGLTSIAGSYHWLVFNVGDSRVYRYAGGELAQLTSDHTEVAELVASGAITAEEARCHPRRHVVTRALGSDPAPEADVWIVPSVSGERFVVCSDGLPLEVRDADVISTLNAATKAEGAASALVECALDGGGRDNVTVIVLDTADEHADDAVDDTVPRQSGKAPSS